MIFIEQERKHHFILIYTKLEEKDIISKDFICSDTFEHESDYFKLGTRYGRVFS